MQQLKKPSTEYKQQQIGLSHYRLFMIHFALHQNNFTSFEQNIKQLISMLSNNILSFFENICGGRDLSFWLKMEWNRYMFKDILVTLK